jgi:hypothetical protein
MWEWYRDRYMGAAHGVMGIIFMLLHVPSMREARAIQGRRNPGNRWKSGFGLIVVVNVGAVIDWTWGHVNFSG